MTTGAGLESGRTGGEALTIEELSQRTGVTVRSLRAYQSRRLLPPPEVRARTGYYDERHVARVELIKQLQAEGFKLSQILRMLGNSGESDTEVLAFTRAVQSLFGETEHQIVGVEELMRRFSLKPGSKGATELLAKAEKLGLLRRVTDDQFEEVAPRVLRAGEAALEVLGGDVKGVLRTVEQLRRHSEGIAADYVRLYVERVWQPFVEAGRPDEEWPRVQQALGQVRSLAEEALLGVFDLVMAEQIDETFGRELARGATSSRDRRTRDAG